MSKRKLDDVTETCSKERKIDVDAGSKPLAKESGKKSNFDLKQDQIQSQEKPQQETNVNCIHSTVSSSLNSIENRSVEQSQNGAKEQTEDQRPCTSQNAVSVPEQNPNHIENALDLVNNESQQSQIFMLTVDCFQKIFEWLLLRDIDSLSKTCKSMKTLVGEYFQLRYPSISAEYQDGEVYTYTYEKVILNGLIEFVKKIKIQRNYDPNENQFEFFGKKCKESNVTEMEFSEIRLSEAKIEPIKAMLSNIEAITLTSSTVNGDFYEHFLKFVPNLKRLCITNKYKRKRVCASSQWTLQKYPKLEYFECLNPGRRLKPFLKQNKTIRTLVIGASSLVTNRLWMMKSSVKLEDLFIKIEEMPDSFYKTLRKLHKRGFYQRLHLLISIAIPTSLNEMTSLESLETLHFDWHSTLIFSRFMPTQMLGINTDNFTLLKEVGMYASIKFSDINNLINLERLYLHHAGRPNITPFICQLPKLKVIVIENIDLSDFNDPLFLSAWNLQRQKLPSARKVIIYVDELFLIAVKTLFGRVDWDFVELKYSSSIKWNCPFEKMVT